MALKLDKMVLSRARSQFFRDEMSSTKSHKVPFNEQNQDFFIWVKGT